MATMGTVLGEQNNRNRWSDQIFSGSFITKIVDLLLKPMSCLIPEMIHPIYADLTIDPYKTISCNLVNRKVSQG